MTGVYRRRFLAPPRRRFQPALLPATLEAHASGANVTLAASFAAAAGPGRAAGAATTLTGGFAAHANAGRGSGGVVSDHVEAMLFGGTTMQWSAVDMTWHSIVAYGVFAAKATGGNAGQEAHASGANVAIAASWTARAAGGETGGADVPIDAGFVAIGAGGDVPTEGTYTDNGGIVGNGTTASTAVSIPYPTSRLLAGDIAFLSLHGDNHSVMAVPGDWTPCGPQEDTSGTVSARLWWKRLAGTETGSVACTRGTGAVGEWFGGVITVFRGCLQAGVPFEGYATALSTTTAMSGPAITTTGNGRLAAIFWCQGDNNLSTPPAGYTERFDLGEASGNDGGQALDTQYVPTATTVAAVTRTIAVANPSVAFGLALLPMVVAAYASGANVTIPASAAAGAAKAGAGGAFVTLTGSFAATQGTGGEAGTGTAGQAGTCSGRGAGGRFAGAAPTQAASFTAVGTGGDLAGGAMNFNAVAMTWSGVGMVWNGAEAAVASGANVQLSGSFGTARGAGSRLAGGNLATASTIFAAATTDKAAGAAASSAAILAAAGAAAHAAAAATQLVDSEAGAGAGARPGGASLSTAATFFARGQAGAGTGAAGANVDLAASFAAAGSGASPGGASLATAASFAAAAVAGRTCGASTGLTAVIAAAGAAAHAAATATQLVDSEAGAGAASHATGTDVQLVGTFFARAQTPAGSGASGAFVDLAAQLAGAGAGARLAGASPGGQGTFSAYSSKEGSPSGVVVNLAGALAAAGNTAHGGNGAVQLVDGEAADATTAHRAGADAILTGTFFARAQTPAGSGASGTEVFLEAGLNAAGAAGPKPGGASLATSSTFAAAAAKAGGSGAASQLADNEAAQASGARAAGSAVTIPANGNAAGIQVLGSGASATSTTSFASAGAAGHGGGAAAFSFVTDLGALGAKNGAGAGAVLLLVDAYAGARGARQGAGGLDQSAQPLGRGNAGHRSGAAFTSTLTSGAGLGDLVRPYVQILRCDAIILPAANLNATVRTNFAADVLVTAVERVG
jgi:hypothetical protein